MNNVEKTICDLLMGFTSCEEDVDMPRVVSFQDPELLSSQMESVFSVLCGFASKESPIWILCEPSFLYSIKLSIKQDYMESLHNIYIKKFNDANQLLQIVSNAVEFDPFPCAIVLISFQSLSVHRMLPLLSSILTQSSSNDIIPCVLVLECNSLAENINFPSIHKRI